MFSVKWEVLGDDVNKQMYFSRKSVLTSTANAIKTDQEKTYEEFHFEGIS